MERFTVVLVISAALLSSLYLHYAIKIGHPAYLNAVHSTINLIDPAYAIPENESSSLTGSLIQSQNTSNNEMITVKPPAPQSLITKNRNFLSEPLGLLPPQDMASFLKKTKIALVVPIFTDAAYADAFYQFYSHFAKTKAGLNVTNNLLLLSSSVVGSGRFSQTAVQSGSAMAYLAKHLSLLSPSSQVNVLTDIGVDNGSIFLKNGANRYDVMILGHQEYVTQHEYSNLKRFVADGGILMLLDGNVFFAQVGYDSSTHKVTLIKGHGWSFNGKSAWPSVSERWKNETSRWVGSNFLCFPCHITFANNPFNYTHHEDQYLTNPNDTILLNYNASFLGSGRTPSINPHSYVIATYELNYLKGSVISLGIYSDDIITKRAFLVFFDHLLAASKIL